MGLEVYKREIWSSDKIKTPPKKKKEEMEEEEERRRRRRRRPGRKRKRRRKKREKKKKKTFPNDQKGLMKGSLSRASIIPVNGSPQCPNLPIVPNTL